MAEVLSCAGLPAAPVRSAAQAGGFTAWVTSFFANSLAEKPPALPEDSRSSTVPGVLRYAGSEFLWFPLTSFHSCSFVGYKDHSRQMADPGSFHFSGSIRGADCRRRAAKAESRRSVS